MTIHANHCRCSLCEPMRRRTSRSGLFFATAVIASATLVLILAIWLAPRIHNAMLPMINL